MESKKDNVTPTTKWSFSEEVTNCFGDMLSRSIPNYEVMRSLTYKLGFSFVKHGGNVIDIGCSTGLGVEPFIYNLGFGNNNKFYLIDESEPMVNTCKEKYKSYIKTGVVSVEHSNICKNGLPDIPACLILSILTIQFTPIEYRQKLLKSIYNRLENGGAFIFVEKVLGSTDEMNELLVDNYYQIKKQNGYSTEQIERKRLSLEGVLVPQTVLSNEDMLRKTGFQQIECFWRCLNFCGWIAIK